MSCQTVKCMTNTKHCTAHHSASFETLGSREGFHGLCLPEFRLDDGRFDITPIEEEVPRQQKVDPEWANDYCATGKGVNPYSTLHDVCTCAHYSMEMCQVYDHSTIVVL